MSHKLYGSKLRFSVIKISMADEICQVVCWEKRKKCNTHYIAGWYPKRNTTRLFLCPDIKTIKNIHFRAGKEVNGR